MAKNASACFQVLQFIFLRMKNGNREMIEDDSIIMYPWFSKNFYIAFYNCKLRNSLFYNNIMKWYEFFDKKKKGRTIT